MEVVYHCPNCHTFVKSDGEDFLRENKFRKNGKRSAAENLSGLIEVTQPQDYDAEEHRQHPDPEYQNCTCSGARSSHERCLLEQSQNYIADDKREQSERADEQD